MPKTPSKRRRDGRNAFDPSVEDPTSMCPYKKDSWGYEFRLRDFLDGWEEARVGYEKEMEGGDIDPMPEPGTQEYEEMVDFMRKDIESGFAYSKIIDMARKLIEARGGNFEKEFELWKKERGYK